MVANLGLGYLSNYELKNYESKIGLSQLQNSVFLYNKIG